MESADHFLQARKKNKAIEDSNLCSRQQGRKEAFDSAPFPALGESMAPEGPRLVRVVSGA